MKIKLNRRKIEIKSTSVFFILSIILIFIGIFYTAESVFRWNIISRESRKIVQAISYGIFFIIISCFFISLLMNISIISTSIENKMINLKDNDDV